ncbi:MAG: serpin family protein [Phycisphaerae bacterium]
MRRLALVFYLVVVLPSAVLAGEAPRSLLESAIEHEIATGLNEFGLKLLDRVDPNAGQNALLSPWSIQNALAVTCAGARGKTAEQMQTVLGLPTEVQEPTSSRVGDTVGVDRPTRHKGVADLSAAILAQDKKDRPYHLILANRLWAQKGFEIRREFSDFLKKYYDAEMERLDFDARKAAAIKAINQWVSKKTHGRIPKLLEPEDVTRDTRLVLTNAVYLKATWLHSFSKHATRTAPWKLPLDTRSKKDPYSVKMMSQVESLKFYEGDDMMAVDLPYKGSDLAMTVILPDREKSLSAVRKKLRSVTFARMLEEMVRTNVHVQMPRFTMRCRYGLAAPLGKLGMPLAFTSAADFAGITQKTPLLISKVIHEAWCKVNEEGTEAAAATAVVMRPTGRGPSKRVSFRADRPFLFAIRHVPSRSILFLGQVVRPDRVSASAEEK